MFQFSSSSPFSLRWMIISLFTGCIAVICLGIFMFTSLLSAPKSANLTFNVSGFTFHYPADRIRAHAQKNGETYEITLLSQWSPDVRVTASLSKSRESEGVTLMLRPAQGDLDPAERVKLLYPRFLTGAVFAGPEGLSGQVFTPNSAYDGEVLFTHMSGFAARCEQAVTTETTEYCLRDLRLGGGKLDMTLRFPRQYLSDWREIDKNILIELEKSRLMP